MILPKQVAGKKLQQPQRAQQKYLLDIWKWPPIPIPSRVNKLRKPLQWQDLKACISKIFGGHGAVSIVSYSPLIDIDCRSVLFVARLLN